MTGSLEYLQPHRPRGYGQIKEEYLNFSRSSHVFSGSLTVKAFLPQRPHIQQVPMSFQAIWCVFLCSCHSLPSMPCAAHAFSTPAGSPVRAHTSRPKGEAGTKEAVNDPLTRDDRQSGILFYFSLFPPPPQIIPYPCCSLRGLQVCRPLTVEVWISCHIGVRAQQKSRTLVLKGDHFQLPHLNTHTPSLSLSLAPPHTHTYACTPFTLY